MLPSVLHVFTPKLSLFIQYEGLTSPIPWQYMRTCSIIQQGFPFLGSPSQLSQWVSKHHLSSCVGLPLSVADSSFICCSLCRNLACWPPFLTLNMQWASSNMFILSTITEVLGNTRLCLCMHTQARIQLHRQYTQCCPSCWVQSAPARLCTCTPIHCCYYMRNYLPFSQVSIES